MAVFLQSIEQIRKVNWAPKHLWDVRFVDQSQHTSQLIPPFSQWFPASEITIDEGNVDSHGFDMANISFEIPAYTSQRTMTLTVFDSADYIIFQWLRDWVTKDILNLDKSTIFVSRLQSIYKTVHITKMNSQKSVIDSQAYYVFPKSPVLWEGISQPAAQQYSMTFSIIGQFSE